MNYFAHGMRFVDRPYFLAGTAVPDWLSVADRRTRMRSRRVAPVAAEDSPIDAEIAAGVLQHLEDDQLFHRSPVFLEVSGQMSDLFRDLLGPDDGFRPGFLGHIVTELLLDGVLIERHPERLNEYYRALESIDPLRIQSTINWMARTETSRLAEFIPMFQREQFLRDYVDPIRLLYRLNQVMRRIKLNPLPDETESVLKAGWLIVAENCDSLLPFD